MLNVSTLENAYEAIDNHFKKYPLKRIAADIDDCCGKVVANDVFAKENLPPYTRSTVDGYAVVAADTYGSSEALPTLLKLSGQVEMGKRFERSLSNGEAVYVPTGGMLPDGANAVVMLEYADEIDGEVAIYKPVRPNENAILAGEDIKNGETVLKTGDVITPLKIGLLCALGIVKVEVFEKPSLFIISQGNELVSADSPLLDCQIRDSNSHLLSAALADTCNVVGKRLVGDNLALLTDAVDEAISLADIVVLSGGSSVGEQDYTYTALKNCGCKILIRGLNLKPGKPTMLAAKGKKLVFGLAGHPMAAAVTANLLIDTSLRRAMNASLSQPKIMATAAINFPSASGRTTLMPVSLSYDCGQPKMFPLFSKSGLISVLAKADGYALIPPDTEGVYKNQLVEVTLL